jgi:ketopantoate reductase
MELCHDLDNARHANLAQVIDVARKCDVPLSYDLIDTLIEKILALPGIRSSMQADSKAGRQMEVEIILGTPVHKAKELGVSVPVLDTLYAILVGLNVNMEMEEQAAKTSPA